MPKMLSEIARGESGCWRPPESMTLTAINIEKGMGFVII